MADKTLGRRDNLPTRFFSSSLFSKIMLTGKDDSLDDSYKLIWILVKLMTRAGIVSRFLCLKAVENERITHMLVKRMTYRPVLLF